MWAKEEKTEEDERNISKKIDKMEKKNLLLLDKIDMVDQLEHLKLDEMAQFSLDT